MLPCLQAGLHQLIMQQAYSQVAPGLPGLPAPFVQQLGPPASWAAAGGGAAGGGGVPAALPGLEALAAMQQHMGSQVGVRERPAGGAGRRAGLSGG